MAQAKTQKGHTKPKDGIDYGTRQSREKLIQSHGKLPLVRKGNDKHIRNKLQIPSITTSIKASSTSSNGTRPIGFIHSGITGLRSGY